MKSRQESLDESILPARRRQSRSVKARSKFKLRDNLPLIGYIAFGISCFFIFLLLMLPFGRFSSQVLAQLNQSTGLRWEAKEVSIGLLLGPSVSLEGVSISPGNSYVSQSGDPITLLVGEGITIDSLTVRPSLWNLLYIPWLKDSKPGGSFAARFAGASLHGSFAQGRNLTSLELNVKNLDLAKAPGLKQYLEMLQSNPGAPAGSIALPKYGVLGILEQAEIELSLPKGKLGTASGEVNLDLENLRLEQAVGAEASVLGKGLNIVNLGAVLFRAKIKNGVLTLQELTSSGKNSDLEAKMEGEITLNDEPMLSRYNVVLSLKPKEKLKTIVSLLGTLTHPGTGKKIMDFEIKNDTYSTRLRGFNFRDPPDSTPYRSTSS